MVAAMRKLAAEGSLSSTPQDESLVTYAHKLEKSEAAIDWRQTAEEISRQIRAFNPFPVAQAQLNDQVCRIWMATVADMETGAAALPGEIIGVRDGIQVACGKGVLNLLELQAPGGKRLTAQIFAQGQQLKPGHRFF